MCPEEEKNKYEFIIMLVGDLNEKSGNVEEKKYRLAQDSIVSVADFLARLFLHRCIPPVCTAYSLG